MIVDGIVSAYNEEQTIAPVIRALRESRVLRRVLVVDDGSKDGTTSTAIGAGADVLRLHKNGGKGQAMLAGVAQCRRIAPNAPSDRVAFFDADLYGLRPDHIRKIVGLSEQGFDMVCALHDYGLVGNAISLTLPVITGDRILKPWILDRLPADCWNGYKIETGFNRVCEHYGGRRALCFFDGVTYRSKESKTGFWKGFSRNCDMLAEIGRTHAAMRATDCRSCGP